MNEQEKAAKADKVRQAREGLRAALADMAKAGAHGCTASGQLREAKASAASGKAMKARI